MSDAELTQQAWPLLASLAGEIMALAGVLWMLLKRDVPALWRRTICRAALVAALLILSLELSGSSRSATRWMVSVWPSRAGAVAGPSRAMTPGEKLPTRLPAKASQTEVQVAQGRREREEIGELTQRRNQARTDFLATQPALLTSEQVSSRAAQASRSNRSVMMVVAFLAIWFCGTATLALRAATGRWALSRWRRRCPEIKGVEIIEAVARWRQVLGISRRIRVIESANLQSPIAFGIARPTIGLPVEFQKRFNAARAEAMLGHELSHLAGGDPQWCLVADLIVALLWWHPAIWWMRRQMQLAAELAADDSSLLIADGPRVLSECLVELGAQMLRQPAHGQLSAGGSAALCQ